MSETVVVGDSVSEVDEKANLCVVSNSGDMLERCVFCVSLELATIGDGCRCTRGYDVQDFRRQVCDEWSDWLPSEVRELLGV